MAKIWQKNAPETLDPTIESYTVGVDYILDGRLFKYELAASMAHAMMLSKIGILSEDEVKNVSREIKSLYQKHGDTIELSVSDEDVHSKLEALLTASIGDTGKKIHTGRSRNDQVAVVMRLYQKETLLGTALSYIGLLEIFVEFFKTEGQKILPGYTHTKQAMLITAGFWISAFIESGLDNLTHLQNVIRLIDSNPLGSGSGFGVPVALDREYTSQLLGFQRVQNNPMAVQNSRGKYDGIIIDSYWNIMNDFSRLASDMLLFNMDELLFIKTGKNITTGSSIMPQKRNLDVMELIRARTNVMHSYSTLVKNTVTGLISGYNRDGQEIKEPMMKATDLIASSIKSVAVVMQHIEIDETAVLARLSKGIFATDIAFKAVGEGMPFREAYKLAAEKMNEIEVNSQTAKKSIEERVSQGSPITLSVENYEKSLLEAKTHFKTELQALQAKWERLLK